MRWTARRASRHSPRARLLTVLLGVLGSAVALGAVLLVPASAGVATDTHTAATPTPTPSQSAAAPTPASSQSAAAPAPSAPATAQAFGGVPFVGALYSAAGGPDSHFCTASVVQSTHGDLAVTAAHCLAGIQGQVMFVPGYANGKEPYGVWEVTAVYTDQAWQSSQNPDDDVAFLRLAHSNGVAIQDVTGADLFGADNPSTGNPSTGNPSTGSSNPSLVRVIGYPVGAGQPVSCVNRAQRFSATQLQFDCDGYTDGTSGGPFVTAAPGANGAGTIVGVIGGYQQGGDTPDVSYAPAFGATVTALYRQAEAAG